MLSALQALRFTKKIRNIKIGILLTTDDALQGCLSRNIVAQQSRLARYVIGLHGAFLNGGIVTSRSGSAVYSFSLKLITGEDAAEVALASQIFNKIIGDIVKLSDQDAGLVIAPHKMQFESNITEPFAHGEALISIRFNDSQQMNTTDDKIKRLLPRRKYRDQFDFNIEGGIRRPSMMRSEAVIATYNKIKAISDKLDIRLREEHRWSSADISFADGSQNIIDGLGPIGIKPSDKSEYILRHSLLERATLLAMSIIELSRQDEVPWP